MSRSVLGFAFAKGAVVGRERVLLVRKSHPPEQRGRYNGLGGRFKGGETPERAMARAFAEECGIEVEHYRWAYRAHLFGPDREIFVFRTFLADAPYDFGACNAGRAEPVAWFEVGKLLEVGGHVEDLRWLVPLVLANILVGPVRIKFVV